MKFTHNNNTFTFKRYPFTTNKSLRAWSAGDEYLLKKMDEIDTDDKSVAIFNDRFGFLSTTLHHLTPLIIADRKSQVKSIEMNVTENNLTWNPDQCYSPLAELPGTIDIGVINVPKTLDLFRLYLHQLSEALTENGIVFCSFMTRHFSPQMLSIAGEFFEDTDQSLAWKKSRVLVLQKKKSADRTAILNTIPHTFADGHTQEFKQYAGVFSSDNIDYATQFLIEHTKLNDDDRSVLDVGAGNGIIARALQRQKPDTEIHLIDDSLLAIESSKLNLEPENTYFHWSDTLDDVTDKKFDLVVSNPPFHFGHEVNSEVAIDLFREAAGVLKTGGRFICVANQHLGYSTHLKKFFRNFEILSQTDKYILYQSGM